MERGKKAYKDSMLPLLSINASKAQVVASNGFNEEIASLQLSYNVYINVGLERTQDLQFLCSTSRTVMILDSNNLLSLDQCKCCWTLEDVMDVDDDNFKGADEGDSVDLELHRENAKTKKKYLG